MPPKLNIVRKRTSITVNNEIEKLQKEIDTDNEALSTLKKELIDVKKKYQATEKSGDVAAEKELKDKHVAGAKRYSEISEGVKVKEGKMYGLKKEYAELKAKEDEAAAAAAAAKAKEEEKAAAAADGDIVIDTSVVNENGESVPLVVNFGDDYEKVVDDFVSLYGLDEDDYDDLLDQVYDALSDEEEGDDDDDEREYYDEEEEEEDDDDYDDDDDSYYEYEDEDEDNYYLEFNTDIKDPQTGEYLQIKVCNTDDFREFLGRFRAEHNVKDTAKLNELLLRIFAGFRYVEIDTYDIDKEDEPLGLFSDTFERVLADYARENRLPKETRAALVKEVDDALSFYEDVWDIYTALASNGMKINAEVARKEDITKIATALNAEVGKIAAEGRQIKEKDPKRFEELLKVFNAKKLSLNKVQSDYNAVCARLSELYEERKDTEKRFADLKEMNKTFVPTL